MKKLITLLVVAVGVVAGALVLALSPNSANATALASSQGISPFSGTPTWQDDGFVADSFGGGNGTAQSPYLISTPQQFARIARLVNNGGLEVTNQTVDWWNVTDVDGLYFRLTNNIDLRGRDWVSIGGARFGFGGTLDGDGFEIVLPNTLRQELVLAGSLEISASADPANFGLFGVTYHATIKNLRLRGDVIDWTSSRQTIMDMRTRRVGGLVATALFTTIYNVEVVGHLSNIIAPRSSIIVGGIIGQAVHSHVEQVLNHTRLNVISTNDSSVFVGGIAGGARETTIINAVNRGNISEIIASTTLQIGGIVGLPTWNSERQGSGFTTWAGNMWIYNVANYGDIYANLIHGQFNPPREARVGGIAGEIFGNPRTNPLHYERSIIANAYNRGNITVIGTTQWGAYIGGITGQASARTHIPVMQDGVQIDTIIADNVRIMNVYNSGTLIGENTGEIVARIGGLVANGLHVENAFSMPLPAYTTLRDNLNTYRNTWSAHLLGRTSNWAIGLGGHPQLIGLSYLPFPENNPLPTFTVTFRGANNAVLYTRTISQGTIITPIEAPTIMGHLFLYWRTLVGNDIFTRITMNTEYVAIYNALPTELIVSVTFHDWYGNILSQIEMLRGSLIPYYLVPEVPTLRMMEFCSWFNTHGFGVDQHITQSTTFWAVYVLGTDDGYDNGNGYDDPEREIELWLIVVGGFTALIIIFLILNALSKALRKKKRGY